MYWRTGLHMAYWFVPRVASDSAMRDTYAAPGGRQSCVAATTRPRRRPTSRSATPRRRLPPSTALRSRTSSSSGPTGSGMPDGRRSGSSTAWPRRRSSTHRKSCRSAPTPGRRDESSCSAMPRTALRPTAAWASPAASSARTSSPVRSTPCPTTWKVPSRRYDSTLRPFVDQIQAAVKPRLLALGLPRPRIAVAALQAAFSVACALRVPERIAARATTDRGGDWVLPHSEQAPAAAIGNDR